MNLVIVTPYPPTLTGIGQYGYHVSRVLAQSGAFSSITVLTGAAQGIPRPVSHGPITVETAWRQESLDAAESILARLDQLKPDLVWYNLGASIFGRQPLANLANFVRLGLGWGCAYPSVVTLHELIQLADLHALNAPGGRLARFGAGLFMNVASRADAICLTSRRYVDWFAAHRPNLTCFHIPIGAYAAPELLPEPPDPELLFFTTHAPFKGLEVLLSAYRSLLARHPALRLTIAGAEHPRFPGYLEDVRLRSTDLAGIRWLGPVPEERVRTLFEQSQIVVLPYRASTGSSSVAFQAAAWGRPLVVSDIPEMGSLADENGLDVRFFHNGSAQGLAQAVSSLLASPDTRRSQAEHNFSVIQRMGPEQTCRLYLQAFNRALETHQIPERLRIPAAMKVEFS